MKSRQTIILTCRKKGVYNIHIATYNVRTLLEKERLLDFEHEIKAIKWDIIETRNNSLKLASGNILYTSEREKWSIGSWISKLDINKDIANNVIEFKDVVERVTR